MHKKLLCAALLAAGTACAHAAETTWQFAYQGFVNAATGVFDPAVKLTGTFRGEDGDADGIIALDELTYFATDGRTYIEPMPPGEPDWGDPTPVGGCAAAMTPYFQCQVNAFSYKLTGELAYSVRNGGHDEFSLSWYENIVTGSYFNDGGGNWALEQSWETRYNWSDQTTFTISPPPVPEPAVALMLPAGLALVLAAARRRKQKVSL
jgi:hypothetical protein